MWSSYEFWLTDDTGRRIEFLEPRWWQYARVVNSAGWFALGLDSQYDHLLKPDFRIEIWRRPADYRLGLEMIGLIRDWELWSTDDDQGTNISGPDINDLLDRRIVGYAAASTEADKTDYADDMMKEMVDENLGAGAVAARDITGLGLSIASDLSDGPSLSKAFAWQNMLKSLGAINQASRSEGNEVFFAIIPITNTLFQFQTYTGQPGVDRTQTGSTYGLTISQEWGNLKNPTLSYKHSAESNYIYAGGQGLADEREVVEVEDAVRVGTSQWNRRERFTNASNAKTTAAITGAGNDALSKYRPTVRFAGTLVDSPSARYGVHWGLGDKLPASYRGELFDVIARAVMVSVNSSGNETITSKLEYQR